MLYASFRLDLFSFEHKQYDLWNFDPKTPIIAPNKFVEAQLSWSPHWSIAGELNLDFKGQDHAGLRVSFNLLGLWFIFSIYDHRHWDYDKDQWEEPGHYSAGPVKAPDPAAPNNVIIYADGTGRKSGDDVQV